MNMVATLPDPESTRERIAAPSPAARPLPLWGRVTHLCAHELRRQRLLVLLMWLLPLASLAVRGCGLGYHVLISYISGPIEVVFCVVLACRCVWASSAARAERMVHTQPVGRLALILGQVLFMLVAIVIPWVLLDAVVGMGFGFSGTQWLQLVLGSVLMMCLPLGLSAAWVSAARTYRQLGVIFIVTLLVWWGAVLFCSEVVSVDFFDWLGADDAASRVQTTVHFIGAGLLGLALWVLQSLLHRRTVMLYAALAGGVLLAFITIGWSWDWTYADVRPYTAGTPKLVLHGADMENRPGVTHLWEGVAVEGMQQGEAAVIAQFFHRNSRYPTSFSDSNDPDRTEYNRHGERVGVNVDMLRSIAGSLPEGWLISDDGNLSPRAPLAEVLQSALQNMSPVTQKDPWLLQVAILQPRLVAEFPLQEIINREKQFLLEPGVRVAIGEKKKEYAFMELWIQAEDRQPILSKEPSDLRRSHSSQAVARKLYVLLLDDSRKMAQTEVSPAITRNFHATGLPGMTFSASSLYDTLHVEGPQARMALTGMTREQWISNVRVQIWWPELKGYHTLQIPGADLQRLAQ
jgi:hypothetical protein